MHSSGKGAMAPGGFYMQPPGGMPMLTPVTPGAPQLGPPGPGQEGSPDPKSKWHLISRSATTLSKIPKCHNVDGIFQVDARLDPTLTAKMETDEISITVWLVTRMRPDVRVVDLRCEYYEELWVKYEVAAKRLKDS